MFKRKTPTSERLEFSSWAWIRTNDLWVTPKAPGVV